jgi:glycosyltransferase involved in cell wall biosynthesis
MKAVDPKECESLLVCITDPRHGETPWLRELKGASLPFVTIPVSRRFGVRDLVTLPAWICRFQADIVHSHDHRADIVGITGAKITRRRAVATFHGRVYWPVDPTRKGRVNAWLDCRALRHADAIIAPSAAAATQVDCEKKGPPVVVIPHGVDTRTFDPALVGCSFRRRFFAEDEVLIVAVVGRIHPSKGQLEFLRASAELISSRPCWRFLIVGAAEPDSGDYKREIMRFITEKGLEKTVIVTEVAHAEIPALMTSVDIIVAPTHTETFGRSLLEAMAMGKAVVANRVGGTPELIDDGVTGLLVPPGDVHAISRAMERLTDDRVLRVTLGRQARKKVESVFSVEAMVARTVRVYREMMGRNHRTSLGSPGDATPRMPAKDRRVTDSDSTRSAIASQF